MFVIIDDIIYFKCKRSKHKQLNYLKLVVPKILIPKILEEYHSNNGHLGQNKTEDIIRERYWFPGLRDITRQHCRQCNCNGVKAWCQKPFGRGNEVYRSIETYGCRAHRLCHSERQD